MTLRAALLIGVVSASSFFISAHAATPSFDCSKAWRADEQAVCENDDLARLDNILAFGFSYLKANVGKPIAQELARRFLKKREACGAETNCLYDASVEAINSYKDAGAPIEVPEWPHSAKAVGSTFPDTTQRLKASTLSQPTALVNDNDVMTPQGAINAGLATPEEFRRALPLFNNYTDCVFKTVANTIYDIYGVNKYLTAEQRQDLGQSKGFVVCTPPYSDAALIVLIKQFNMEMKKKASQ